MSILSRALHAHISTYSLARKLLGCYAPRALLSSIATSCCSRLKAMRVELESIESGLHCSKRARGSLTDDFGFRGLSRMT